VDEDSLYSCIGIAGAQDAQDVAGVVIFLMPRILNLAFSCGT